MGSMQIMDKDIIAERQPITEPSWDGVGLPPVGVRCEHCPGGTTQQEWEVVTVAGIYENLTTGFTDFWMIKESGSSYIVGNPYRFRPIRSEEDKKRDAVIEFITGAIDSHGVDPLNSAKFIYDAIADGKIPGVKLED